MSGSEVSIQEEGEISRVTEALSEDGSILQIHPESFTVFDHFLKTVRAIPDRPYTCSEDDKDCIHWKSYGQINEFSARLASEILRLDLCPEVELEEDSYKLLGIFSENREEVAICEWAAIRQNIATVPLNDSFSKDQLTQALTETSLPVLCISRSLLEIVLEVKLSCPNLLSVIQFEDPTPEERSKASKTLVSLYGLNELINMGSVKEDSPPQYANDTAFLYFAPGSDKPEVVNHGDLLAQISAHSASSVCATPADLYLSYQSMADFYEKLMFHLVTLGGGKIAFFAGEANKFIKKAAIICPSIICLPQQILSRIHEKIYQEINKKFLFSRVFCKIAVNLKMKNLKKSGIYHSKLDYLFRSLKNSIGGKVRLMRSAKAFSDPSLKEFAQICFSCPVIF